MILNGRSSQIYPGIFISDSFLRYIFACVLYVFFLRLPIITGPENYPELACFMAEQPTKEIGAVNGWLAGFAYHINVGWTVFFIAALAALSIAWLTVSYESVKAAIVNPIKSLRTE